MQLADDGVGGVDLEGWLQQAVLLIVTLTCEGGAQKMASRPHLCHRDEAGVGDKARCHLTDRVTKGR